MSKAPVRKAKQSAGEVLSRRVLNRTLLERQLLLERRSLPVLGVIEHLVGMQAQEPLNPYTALWSRLDPFDPDELGRLITEREAVRIAVMRSTLHLVSARDCLYLRPLAQPPMTRALYSSSPFGRAIAGVDNDELLAMGRALLEEKPRTIAELGRLLQERWPDRDANSLAYGVHYQLPLVQVPPRGVWGKTARPACTTAEAWLGRPLQVNPSIDELVRRYLRAFGPATVADMQNWSGIPGLRPAFERLRPELRSYRDEYGKELFDVPDGILADPELPAPARFLPEYDNVFLGHADRRRIISDEHRRMGGVGVGPSTFLIDGFIAGTWRIVRDKKAARLVIGPIEPLSAADSVAVVEEGARMLAFVAGDATPRDVELVTPA